MGFGSFFIGGQKIRIAADMGGKLITGSFFPPFGGDIPLLACVGSVLQ